MRIVVVEDVPMVRERIVDALLELPGVIVVGEADCVETALSTIEQNQPDVVLLDMSLPSASPITNGLGILKWIKQFHPAMHVVMLTNHVGQPYRDACVAAGAYDYLDKSYEFDKLPAVIEQLGNDILSYQHKTNLDDPSTHRLDRTSRGSLGLVLWLYFLLAAIGYIQAARDEGRKEHSWRN